MKNSYYLHLGLLLILVFSVSCEPENSDEKEPEEEVIYIPDEHFKNALVSTNSIDTNGDRIGDSDIDLNNDGEIQRTEAEVIESLILQFEYDEIQRYVDLNGIENFVNLKYLEIQGSGVFFGEEDHEVELITYDFTNLKKLQFLELNNVATNYFEALNLSGLNNLVEVNLLTNRPNVYGEEFRIPINFMDINCEGCGSLTKLNIHNSFLNIDFCQIPSLKVLDISYLEGGEPEVFDFHCLTNLEWLDISDNRIKSLILKNSSLLNTLVARDIGYGEDGFANYPYLEYICIDDIPEEYDQIVALKDEDTSVTTACTF